jgi:hypothetical protein
MVVVEDHQQREPSMSEITTIGLDLAKNIFQVHGVDGTGTAIVVKRLRRSKVFLPASHHVWSAWKLARQRITGPAS